MLEQFALDTPFLILADVIDEQLGRKDLADYVRRWQTTRKISLAGQWMIEVQNETWTSVLTAHGSPGWIMCETEQDAMMRGREWIEEELKQP